MCMRYLSSKILSVCLFYQDITLLLHKFNFSKVKNYKKIFTEKDIPPPPNTRIYI